MVLLGESSSEKRYTENGVIQGAVINVILFLLALADIVSQVQHPVEIIGYADDRVVHTNDQDMDIAQANIEAALNSYYHLGHEEKVSKYHRKIHWACTYAGK
jgi:hypothetical protein